MLRIRLSRVGAKRQASYRIVVADVESRRDGRVVERIGFYNPRTDPLTFKIEEERALHWLSVGAQPSDAVRRLLVKQGTLDRLQRLRDGEGLDSLVAEYLGVPLAAAAAPVAAAAVEEEPVAETAVAEDSVEVVDEVAAETAVAEEAVVEETAVAEEAVVEETAVESVDEEE